MAGELEAGRSSDDLHRMILDQILPQFGLGHLDEARRRAEPRLAPAGPLARARSRRPGG
jgi:hypothetical protein